MYIVILNRTEYFLRGTVLTSDIDRASRYATTAEAQAAIDKAKPFHKARTIKALTVTAE